jgi:hypothetical protein
VLHRQFTANNSSLHQFIVESATERLFTRAVHRRAIHRRDNLPQMQLTAGLFSARNADRLIHRKKSLPAGIYCKEKFRLSYSSSTIHRRIMHRKEHHVGKFAAGQIYIHHKKLLLGLPAPLFYRRAIHHKNHKGEMAAGKIQHVNSFII